MRIAFSRSRYKGRIWNTSYLVGITICEGEEGGSQTDKEESKTATQAWQRLGRRKGVSGGSGRAFTSLLHPFIQWWDALRMRNLREMALKLRQTTETPFMSYLIIQDSYQFSWLPTYIISSNRSWEIKMIIFFTIIWVFLKSLPNILCIFKKCIGMYIYLYAFI